MSESTIGPKMHFLFSLLCQLPLCTSRVTYFITVNVHPEYISWCSFLSHFSSIKGHTDYNKIFSPSFHFFLLFSQFVFFTQVHTFFLQCYANSHCTSWRTRKKLIACSGTKKGTYSTDLKEGEARVCSWTTNHQMYTQRISHNMPLPACLHALRFLNVFLRKKVDIISRDSFPCLGCPQNVHIRWTFLPALFLFVLCLLLHTI